MSPTGSTRSDPIHPAELGGTLFVPATHPRLAEVVRGNKYPSLRSLVIDAEDGIDDERRGEALGIIRELLPILEPDGPLRFLRPDTPATLSAFLAMKGIDAVDGFILPKFGLRNFDDWLTPLRETRFHFMPSIEGAELFDAQDLHTLADLLRPFRRRIPTIRFGLEDMLRQLAMVRDCDTNLYDLAAPSLAIATLVCAFKPLGFNVSGGVYKCYKNDEGFLNEVREDLRQGLFGKTLIHPRQAELIAGAYKVTPEERARAEAIVQASHTVSAHEGIMLEKPTQLPWARMILERAELYGVSEPAAT